MTSEKLEFRQPPEWDPHLTVWTAWPSHAEYWEGHIEEARSDFTHFIQELAKPGKRKGVADPEPVIVWADGKTNVMEARNAFAGWNVKVENQPLGDIWFRDIGPIFVRSEDGQAESRVFLYNGWGEKYRMKNDDTVGFRIAEKTLLRNIKCNWVLEGGAIDTNGAGTILTTRQCLLNPNRNPKKDEAKIVSLLKEDLGVKKVIWIEEGLRNDHTDGHIDNIARFIGENKVVIMKASGTNDPNEALYSDIKKQLEEASTAEGKSLEIVEIPSPGKVFDRDGNILPASHLNFYISNHKVLVPTYRTPYEKEALKMLQDHFPDREVVGLYSKGLLLGGGSFHCITQQKPVYKRAHRERGVH